MEQTLRHQHDLLFIRLAIARHRLFDLDRRILKNRHPQFFRSQQNNAPAMGNRNTRGNIGAEEQFLNGHLIRLKEMDQFLHIVGDLEQPTGQRDPRRGRNGAILDQRVFLTLGVDHAKTDGGHSGVDA